MIKSHCKVLHKDEILRKDGRRSSGRMIQKNKISYPQMCLFGLRIDLGWLFFKKQRHQEVFLVTPLYCLKEFRERACSGTRAITRDNKVYGLGRVRETWQGLGIRVSSVSIASAWPSKHLLTKYLLFRLEINCLLHLWSPKPLPLPSILSVFNGRWHLRWELQLFCQVTQFSWVSCVHPCYWICWFFSC